MEIIDNFGLPSRSSSDFNPWLESILDKIKTLSNKDFILRLSGERQLSSVIYKLHNNQNKTYSVIYKKNKMIRASVFKCNLPDPEIGIKPIYQEIGTYAFDATDEGLTKASKVLYDALDEDTPYSLGEVTKVKVLPALINDNPWSFTGGRISAIVQGKDTVNITVEDGKQTYYVPRDQTLDKRISVLKYIIFNDKGEFQLISSSEFDFYFEMNYVQ